MEIQFLDFLLKKVYNAQKIRCSMKKLTYPCSVICIALILLSFCFGCVQPNNTTDEKVTELQEKVKELESLVIAKNKESSFSTPKQVSSHQGPSRTTLKQAESYVFEFSRDEYDLDFNFESSSMCHCFIYAHKDASSFIALPRHCFKYNKTKRYELSLIDQHGRKTILDWNTVISDKSKDAAIIEVSRLDYIASFSGSGNIDQNSAIGDSVSLLTLFGSRKVYQKKGVLDTDGSIKINTFHIERGDSGSLVVGRNGVLGVSFAKSKDGTNLYFTPITVFEELYTDLVEAKHDKD